ncbi:hypothetical protein Q8A73_016934 [Channa argus]|nr:hypothetical protein Q8A73_016934 [Channa argus]
MSGLAEGGRDVPDLPLKLDTIFVASLLQDMASEVGHPASLGMKYFFLYAARGILNWSNVGPRSEQLPWHYAWVAKWLRAHPKALEDGIWKQQRVLYRVVRGKVNPSPLLGVPSSVTVGVQAVGQTNGLKDLNWACLHRTLPVRDKIHRHGLGRSPLCPRPSCGAGETAYHVMWECSFARQLWAKAKKVVGRAKPDFTLTWQVVERGFVGAHIRSGWGILWLLLSLYKRGLWLARQELVRSEVEWKGGDLRVKLSQYADDTTLLLDSDECVVRALELFEDFGRVSGARLNIGKCTVKGGGRGVMLLRVDYQRGPVAIRRPLARTIFDFLWGGRYEWVARGRMMSGLAEGGRDVPDLPLKLDTIFVASLLQDMASEVGHPASLGMKYFFFYAARGILNWSNVSPRSEQLPWHYAWVVKWLRAHPEALEDGIWKQQRVLYRVVRGKVNPSPLLGVPSSVWVGVQAIHRHGLGRSPLCPRPSCGAGETAYHVVERGFVGAHIRSGWGILWLLLSLYKRGLWLARQELVRNEVEWSGVQRGWLRGSN